MAINYNFVSLLNFSMFWLCCLPSQYKAMEDCRFKKAELMKQRAPVDSTEKGSPGTRACSFCCSQLLRTGQLSLYSTLWYTRNNIKLVRLYTLFRLYPSVSVFAVLEWFQYYGGCNDSFSHSEFNSLVRYIPELWTRCE
jgi:hypothetical protein